MKCLFRGLTNYRTIIKENNIPTRCPIWESEKVFEALVFKRIKKEYILKPSLHPKYCNKDEEGPPVSGNSEKVRIMSSITDFDK